MLSSVEDRNEIIKFEALVFSGNKKYDNNIEIKIK